MAFKKPPMGKRGYDEEDVDAFLDEVEQELTRLLEENAALHDRVQHGAGTAPAPMPAARPSSAELADVAAQLSRMQAARVRAEEAARGLQAELESARRAAVAAPPPPPPEGGDRLAPVLMMARRTADDHLRDAEQTSEALLSESRDRAAQLAGEAEVRATTLESEARRHHTDSINRIEAERATLLDEIDRLGRLAESYRSALRGHIDQQMQDLDSVTRQI